MSLLGSTFLLNIKKQHLLYLLNEILFDFFFIALDVTKLQHKYMEEDVIIFENICEIN